MKFIQFTYVDSVTGVSVLDAPAINGPAFPAIAGLQFVWARESKYPTETPEFFGTVDDDADLSVPGFLAEHAQVEWESLQAAEMRARDPVPFSVSMRQCRLELHAIGKLATIPEVIAALPEGQREIAEIEWEYSPTVERQSPLVPVIGYAIGRDDAGIDDLFRSAVKR